MADAVSLPSPDTARHKVEKGKPFARRGRNARGLYEMEAAELPNGGPLTYPTALDLAGRSLPMITIHVEKRYGSSTVRSCVTAPSME